MPLQFNSAYYLQNNTDVAAAVDSGSIPDARWHFDNFGAAEGRDPNANFDVSYYLEQYPDVAAAFENGVINPFDHFLQFGASENRAPSASLQPIADGFDNEEYLTANPDVAAAVQSGVFASGYQHWVVYGRYETTRPEATFNNGTPVSDVADTIDATELTTALTALSTAQQARADFLNGLELDLDFDGDIDVTAGNVTDANVATLLGNARDDVNDLTDDTAVGNLSSTRSDAFNQAIITEQKALNTDALNTAQQAVNSTTGLSRAITQLESAQTAFQNATTANTAAGNELTAELAKVNSLNGSDYAVNSLTGLTTEAGSNVAISSADGSTPLIVLGANGRLVAAEGVTSTSVQGLNDLLQDANTAYSAQSTLSNATTSFNNALTAVITAEGGTANADLGDYYNDDGSFTITQDADGNDVSVLSNNAPRTSDLLDARADVKAFNTAVENYTSAKATADQLQTLTTDVTTAREAIENSEADGGLGVTLLEGNNNFTNASDVYLYNEDDSAGASLSGFGAGGQDRIFFGDGYNFVQIPQGSQITGNVGDSSALEIFWQQAGNDLRLFVEDQTFGGNSAGTDDLTQITLTGVNADDVNFANGYLSAGQVA